MSKFVSTRGVNNVNNVNIVKDVNDVNIVKDVNDAMLAIYCGTGPRPARLPRPVHGQSS